MLKAVIFDIDGVLLDSFEANLKFFQNLMVAAGYRPPIREEFVPLFPLPMRDVIRTFAPKAPEDEVQRIWEMGRTRDTLYPFHLLHMSEGAGEVTLALCNIYRLALVTSRVREYIFKNSPLAQFERCFPVVVAAQDTVHHKPHPEPLLLATERLGVKPAEAVYVGDAEVDVEAAHAAGMKVIIFSQNSIPGADACITSFKELPNAISSL